MIIQSYHYRIGHTIIVSLLILINFMDHHNYREVQNPPSFYGVFQYMKVTKRVDICFNGITELPQLSYL